jgi:hypothetical protein
MTPATFRKRAVAMLLLAACAGAASASCEMSAADLDALKKLPVAEANAVVTGPHHRCQFALNQVVNGLTGESRAALLHVHQRFGANTVIANALEEISSARADNVPVGVRPETRVVEAVLHQCPMGETACPLEIPMRKGVQFLGGHYVAQDTDATVYAMLSRILALDGRTLAWAGSDNAFKTASLPSAARLNRAADLAHSLRSVDALSRVMRLYNGLLDQAPIGHDTPLQACVWDTVVVLSNVGEPCDKPTRPVSPSTKGPSI